MQKIIVISIFKTFDLIIRHASCTEVGLKIKFRNGWDGKLGIVRYLHFNNSGISYQKEIENTIEGDLNHRGADSLVEGSVMRIFDKMVWQKQLECYSP